ncbi:MAG: hypothetical protein IJ447_08265 [Clostridia bacterium]|nr:hypothetical protein [Clostridia bacterium]
MGLFSNFFKDSFETWLENASDEELEDGYEERRQQWVEDGFGGNGEKTSEMKCIDSEMSRRAEEKWENNPSRNKALHFRWTDVNRWNND